MLLSTSLPIGSEKEEGIFVVPSKILKIALTGIHCSVINISSFVVTFVAAFQTTNGYFLLLL